MTWIVPALLTFACGLLLTCIVLFICYWRMVPQPARLDTVLDLMDSVQRLREARVMEEARRSEFSSFLTPSSPLNPPYSRDPNPESPTMNPPQMRRPFLFSPRLPLSDSRVMRLARTRSMTDLRDPHLVSEPIPLHDSPLVTRPAPFLMSPLSVEVAEITRRIPVEVHLEGRPPSHHSPGSGPLVMEVPVSSPPGGPCPLGTVQNRRHSRGADRVQGADLQMFW